MTSLAPATSGTYQPGYMPNETPLGAGRTNQQWTTALAEWMASMWSYGRRDELLNIMSPIWYSSKYGEPDPTDTDGVWSPRTILAFSRFAQDYTPGKSSTIDQMMPYVAPGPNDYVETPEQTATRIAQQNFEQDWAFRNAESAADRAFRGSEGAANRGVSMAGIDQQAKAAAMAAFNDAFQNEISKYGIQAGLFSDQERNKQSAYGTQAGIYDTQERTRSSNLQQAGSLSGLFQQLLDERTNKAIEAQLNPGDFLAREAQVRAMNAPTGTENPAFKDDETLKKIIDALINYKPAEAPQAPAAGTLTAPVAPVAGAFQAPAPIAMPSGGYGGGGAVTTGGATSGGGQITAEAMARLKTAAGVTSSQQLPPSQTSSGAYSGVPASSLSGLTSGQRALVTTGTAGPSLRDDYLDYKIYDPNRNNYEYQKGESISPGSSIWLERLAYGMKQGRMHEFISGDPQADGMPNPEMITIHNPGKKTRVSVTPIKNAMQMRGKKKMAYGSDMFDPATLKLKSYPDEAYQNYPTLSYFQGRTPKAAYDTLATGTASGAYGARLPESGAINYGRYLNVAKDPVSLAMLASSYKSGSRDLFAEVARAKARAPFGQAVQTSLIRT